MSYPFLKNAGTFCLWQDWPSEDTRAWSDGVLSEPGEGKHPIPAVSSLSLGGRDIAHHLSHLRGGRKNEKHLWSSQSGGQATESRRWNHRTLTLTSLCFTDVFIFIKLKTRSSTSKEMTMHFIARLTLLRGFGPEPTISARFACVGCFPSPTLPHRS